MHPSYPSDPWQQSPHQNPEQSTPWPQPAPQQAWPQPVPPQAWPQPAPEPVPPRRRVSTAMVVLSGLLVIALLGLGTSIAVGVRTNDTVTAQRDSLQRDLDRRETTDALRRKQFADADLPAKYRSVREADQRLEVTFSAWIATTIGTDAERVARAAWRSARDACLRAVTTFQTAAQPFPREWFTQSGTPSVVDLSQPDTDCWYEGS